MTMAQLQFTTSLTGFFQKGDAHPLADMMGQSPQKGNGQMFKNAFEGFLSAPKSALPAPEIVAAGQAKPVKTAAAKAPKTQESAPASNQSPGKNTAAHNVHGKKMAVQDEFSMDIGAKNTDSRQEIQANITTQINGKIQAKIQPVAGENSLSKAGEELVADDADSDNGDNGAQAIHITQTLSDMQQANIQVQHYPAPVQNSATAVETAPVTAPITTPNTAPATVPEKSYDISAPELTQIQAEKGHKGYLQTDGISMDKAPRNISYAATGYVDAPDIISAQPAPLQDGEFFDTIDAPEMLENSKNLAGNIGESLENIGDVIAPKTAQNSMDNMPLTTDAEQISATMNSENNNVQGGNIASTSAPLNNGSSHAPAAEQLRDNAQNITPDQKIFKSNHQDNFTQKWDAQEKNTAPSPAETLTTKHIAQDSQAHIAQSQTAQGKANLSQFTQNNGKQILDAPVLEGDMAKIMGEADLDMADNSSESFAENFDDKLADKKLRANKTAIYNNTQSFAALSDNAIDAAKNQNINGTMPAASINTAQASTTTTAAHLATTPLPIGQNPAQIMAVQTAPQAATHHPAQAAPFFGEQRTIAMDRNFATNLSANIQHISKSGDALRLIINPEHLGRIDIEMSKDKQGIHHMRLVTDNEQTRHIILQHRQKLEQDMQQQGQKSMEIQVDLRDQQKNNQENRQNNDFGNNSFTKSDHKGERNDADVIQNGTEIRTDQAKSDQIHTDGHQNGIRYA